MQTRMAYQVVPQIRAHARYAARTARFISTPSTQCRTEAAAPCGTDPLGVARLSARRYGRRMRDLVFATGIALASLTACSKADRPSASEGREVSVPTITVPELASKLAHGECQAVDANGDE